jgi:hypothetical protein
MIKFCAKLAFLDNIFGDQYHIDTLLFDCDMIRTKMKRVNLFQIDLPLTIKSVINESYSIFPILIGSFHQFVMVLFI